DRGDFGARGEGESGMVSAEPLGRGSWILPCRISTGAPLNSFPPAGRKGRSCTEPVEPLTAVSAVVEENARSDPQSRKKISSPAARVPAGNSCQDEAGLWPSSRFTRISSGVSLLPEKARASAPCFPARAHSPTS